MFHKAQKMTKAIGKGQPNITTEEKQLKTNIQAELARELQDLTISFRQAQKNYLNGRRKDKGDLVFGRLIFFSKHFGLDKEK
jgi:hypothetical protein